jgi:hypothetical protein
MRPENLADINRKYGVFFAYFLALLFFSLLCIFFLFRTHQDQVERVGAQQASLNTIQNRQLALSDKMDKLLRNFRLVNSGEVENNLYLINEVSLQVEDMERAYRASDTAAFAVYGLLLREMRASLLVKDSIGELVNRETFLKTALNTCIASYSKQQNPRVDHNSSRFR